MEIAELDDRTAILSVLEVTEELRSSVATDELLTEEDATAILAALPSDTSLLDLLHRSSPGELATSCRRLLEELSKNESSRAPTLTILADPPTDEQLSGADINTYIVLLAGLITLLQTRVKIRLAREKRGETAVEFLVEKKPASTDLLKGLSSTLARIISRNE